MTTPIRFMRKRALSFSDRRPTKGKLCSLLDESPLVGRAKRFAKASKPDGEANGSINRPTREFPVDNYSRIRQLLFIAQYIHGSCGWMSTFIPRMRSRVALAKRT